MKGVQGPTPLPPATAPAWSDFEAPLTAVLSSCLCLLCRCLRRRRRLGGREPLALCLLFCLFRRLPFDRDAPPDPEELLPELLLLLLLLLLRLLLLDLAAAAAPVTQAAFF